MSFFAELKRRNVVRVGIAYVVASWLLLQLTEVLTELLDVSTDVGKIVIILLIIGFVPALIFAWAFELTPEGLKRESQVDRSGSVTAQTGRRLDLFIIAVLVIALGYFIHDEIQDRSEEAAPPAATVAVSEPDPSTAPPESNEPSIAVLPFADMSEAGDQAYFSDGISEELLNLLVRVDGLKVASRTSSFAYKGTRQSISEIGEELKVDHVLEGSVRKAENRVRITAQLIDTATDRHLWSDTYDRELDDIFAVQDEIANAIVHALQNEFGTLDQTQNITVEAATSNLDAYELYLRARGLFIARQNLEESAALFERAVSMDPEFARAWEGLAAVYSVSPGWGITDRDFGTLANQAADRALELDPTLSMAWALKGSLLVQYENDFQAGMDAYDLAIQNDSKNATAYLWRGIAWSSLNFQERAIADGEACLEIDPLYGNCKRFLARFYINVGQVERGLELFQQGAETGFFGSDGSFVYELIQKDRRLAAALAIWNWNQDDRSYPATLILDAYEYPDRDHSAALAKFIDWTESRDLDKAEYRDEFLALRGYQHVVISNNFNAFWIWQREQAHFRGSPYFKSTVKTLGIFDYWRERGFPDKCRPLGDDDFECEE